MSQIEELQGRITAAMERIGVGVAAMSDQSGNPEAEAALQSALDEEKQANGQLEERLSTLKTRHGEELETLRAELDKTAELGTLRAELDGQMDALGRLDMDVQRLRMANDQLRDSNAALRQANEQGVGEPHLINKAMLAELEALRAARATDAAETSAVLARLEPMLANAANLTEGGEA